MWRLWPILASIDATITIVGLSRGWGDEANGIWRYVIDHAGLVGFAAVYAVFVAVVVSLGERFATIRRLQSVGAILAAGCIIGWVHLAITFGG